MAVNPVPADYPTVTPYLIDENLSKTIIMVTHDPHAAERATRIQHLEKGTLR